jgi:hypothetical protein
MLDAGYLILDAGYWILDTGYWILDAGCWILDAGCTRLLLTIRDKISNKAFLLFLNDRYNE